MTRTEKIIYLVSGAILSILLSMFAVCFYLWEWDVSKMDSGGRLAIIFLSFLGTVLTVVIINVEMERLKDEKKEKK